MTGTSRPPIEHILDLARRYRSLPPPRERQRLKTKYGLSYTQIGQALEVSREAAWRWDVGERQPRPENMRRWVEFWEALMAIDRADQQQQPFPPPANTPTPPKQP